MPGTASQNRDVFASCYVNPNGPEAAEGITQRLREVGLVTVDGLNSRGAVLEFASRVMSVVPHRDSGPDGLTVIEDTGRGAIRPGFAGLGRGELEPHTDGSSQPEPPRLMLMVCVRPAEEGGVCLLADGRAVYDDLAASAPDAAAALAEPRTAYFGGSDGHLAQVFAPLGGGRTAIRLRWDGLAQWSPLVRPYLPGLRAAVARHQHMLTLDAGEGYLLDNHRWLHARTAFRGIRRCHRALGNPLFPLPRGFAVQRPHPHLSADGPHVLPQR